MKKVLIHIVAIGLIGFGWYNYSQKHLSEEQQNEQLMEMEDEGATSEEVDKAAVKLRSDADELVFGGVRLSILSAAYVGTLFVIYALPALAHRATQSVYDSTEDVGPDSMGEARSKLAQGDYEGAVAAFHEAAHNDPMNRLPYVEIAKVQLNSMEDPDAAIATLTNAIQGQSWEENDAAFLMFRLAEVFHDDKGDIPSASSVMQQVIDQFPATRHSANAQHKMLEWQRTDEEVV